MSKAKSSSESKELVVLVHGLWMTGVEMAWMALGLSSYGFKTKTFFYSTLISTPEQNAIRLAKFIESLDVDRVHLVAHSMGGIVLSHLLDQFTTLPEGRVVFLGSPVQGSEVAKQVHSHTLLRPLLGQSARNGLLGDVPAWRSHRDLGVIAGSDGFLGVGSLMGGMVGAHDGTVAVTETEVPEAKDSLVLDVGHFDMLFSAEVTRQVASFLKQGQFVHQN